MISERTILWYMSFWGFAMNFMLRMNLNIAIVSMVRHTTKSNDGELLNDELNEYQNNSTTYNVAKARIDNVSVIFMINLNLKYNSVTLFSLIKLKNL